MYSQRRAAFLVPVLVASGCLLLSCTSVDTTTSVPAKASEPYACGKLPTRGVELMSGRDELEGHSSTDLGGGTPSQCIFKDGKDFVLHVHVDDWPRKSQYITTKKTAPEEIRQRLEGRNAEALTPLTSTDVGVDGEGWASGTPGDEGALRWACDEVILVTFSLAAPAEGRDTEEDLIRYARSVLPTACKVTGL